MLSNKKTAFYAAGYILRQKGFLNRYWSYHMKHMRKFKIPEQGARFPSAYPYAQLFLRLQ